MRNEKIMGYFKEEINGLKDWARVFNSREAFRELAQAIFRKEGIPLRQDIENLTPGSNAVFKAGDYVIKIFAPRESGIGTETDFHTELSVMEYIKSKGVAAPKIIAYGDVSDKYLFRYILMEYVEGREARNVLPYYNTEQKRGAVKQLKEILNNLNQAGDHLLLKKDLKKQAIGNPHLQGLPQTLIQDLADCVRKQDIGNYCLVHGDITGENVLIASDGGLRLIDFADSILAPAYYELAPVIFELFRGDKEYVSEFAGEENRDEFLDRLINGLVLHDYCGNLIRDYLTGLHIPYEEVKNMEELKKIIKSNIF